MGRRSSRHHRKSRRRVCQQQARVRRVRMESANSRASFHTTLDSTAPNTRVRSSKTNTDSTEYKGATRTKSRATRTLKKNRQSRHQLNSAVETKPHCPQQIRSWLEIHSAVKNSETKPTRRGIYTAKTSWQSEKRN